MKASNKLVLTLGLIAGVIILGVALVAGPFGAAGDVAGLSMISASGGKLLTLG